MQRILTESAAVANATARAVTFRERDPRARSYPNSQWVTYFGAADYRFIDKAAEGARNLDARTKFFYRATVNKPKMEASGEPLDGAKNYELNIPANVPAANFWSVVLYDPQTRSELVRQDLAAQRSSSREVMLAVGVF
jgi:hypothetical protein